ncbi:hypothetical protein G9A89_017840 [Geosiphon pyriformis]|nr:hypothetical protein G9A89_017840 [Geosiphon pyriformis]
MESVGSSAGGFGSVSAGLRTHQSAKKKRVDTVYSRSASYKKPKKPAAGSVVGLSAGLLSLENIGVASAKPVESWGSEVDSIASSVSGLSDVENMANTMAEETSYAESDIKVSAVPGKMNVDKLMVVKKIFYRIDEFGEASTLSKFPEIIRSSFTSEKSLIKAREMTIGEKILVNNDLKKINSCSDWEVIVKEIPVDLLRLVVESVFSKFGEIVSIKIQLIGFWQKALVEFKSFEVASLVVSKWSVLMGKDSVCVALAVSNKQMWVSRDWHRALLYTLLVGTTAHDLSSLLESYDGKTCFIGRNPNSYVHDRCAVICFGDKAFKLAAISTIPVFKNVSLRWAGLSLASCTHCKQFSHVMVNCSLAGIYKKKSASIARPVSFGGKTWAQVAGGSPFRVIPSGLVGAGLHSGLVSSLMMTDSLTVSHLNDWLAILECFLELLTDHVSGILVRLESIDLVPAVTPSLSLLPAVSETLTSNVDSNIIMDTALVLSSTPPSIVYNAVVELSSSSSKVFTAKVGGLETKLIALEASVGSVLDKLNILCSDIICWHKDISNLVFIVTETKLRGMVRPWITDKFDGVCVFTSGLNSGHMGSGIAIIMDSSLAKHVCKISEIPGWLLSLRLLFGNKLSVSILGLYAGASLVVQFSQVSDINSLVAKAVNETSFVILGGDFNKDESHKCASFRKCFDLGLVNSLSGSAFVKSPTWCNSHGVAKTIDYVLVSSSLINAIVNRSVMGVEDFFNTDHKAVSISVDLGGLLDPQLNLMYKQANKNC